MTRYFLALPLILFTMTDSQACSRWFHCFQMKRITATTPPCPVTLSTRGTNVTLYWWDKDNVQHSHQTSSLADACNWAKVNLPAYSQISCGAPPAAFKFAACNDPDTPQQVGNGGMPYPNACATPGSGYTFDRSLLTGTSCGSEATCAKPSCERPRLFPLFRRCR